MKKATFDYWRGRVDARLDGFADALVLAKADVDRRLDSMGEFRKTVMQVGAGILIGYVIGHAGR